MAPEPGIILFLDEDMPRAVAQGIRRRGYQAVTTPEAGRLSLEDSSQLAYTAAHGDALVTYNQGDFCHLHAEYARSGQEHAGIIIASRKVSIGETVHRLLRLIQSVTAKYLYNTIKWLSEYGG